MANERIERNEENGSVKRNPKNPNNTNGMVITVYREEARRRVSEDPTNKTMPRGIGHDRRALLLAYSRKLRDEACKKVPLPETKTKSKIKNTLKSLSCKET
ncbi:hypothetical protein LR48_Vigan04g183400 [Vigna angularis]|uniref:Uncharacterized protein n=2 Tax=Phaseolus angularis TaxID=3914 RepID=A0A0L9UFZ8_PHAAN|nr:uncharacterized protein HKW66_Vig0102500 [Vigna angularis]KOM41636.1 hypothetical protein LR48_Vigan04g183400 [Vigna angularis]BAT78579.1 hypothetical protein VIGAN_02127400 [Vigna angularis var. angularis]